MNIRDKVLVVEDEKSISGFIRAILSSNGYDVIIARSGSEAFSMISSHCPDLVVLDLGLPDMDGMQIIETVRQWTQLPIIVVSARSYERDKVSALDKGADDYITKPFGAAELLARVRVAIRHTRSGIANESLASSGKFTAGMEVFHVQGGRKQRLSQPQQIMAQDRKIVDEAYAGDIIGVFDPGIFSIGDTLCMPGRQIKYEGIPTFAPEHFARVRQIDTMKRKQFVKGIEQIAQEGAIQIFQEFNTGMEEIIVGVVGVLQFDVLKYRLENEYNVDIRLEPLPYEHIRWIENEDIDMSKLVGTSDMKKIKDLKGRPLLIWANAWSVGMTLERNPGLKLSEFGR